MDEKMTGLVGQYQASQRKTLDEIEATAVGLGQHVREIALQEMLAARPASERMEVCPKCGGRVQAKGQRSKWVQTQAGEVQLTRDY